MNNEGLIRWAARGRHWETVLVAPVSYLLDHGEYMYTPSHRDSRAVYTVKVNPPLAWQRTEEYV